MTHALPMIDELQSPARQQAFRAAEADMRRALMFADFLNELAAPSPAMRVAVEVGGELLRERESREAARPAKRNRNSRRATRLLERDGSDCWYCAKPLGHDVSIEHLTPRALGGSEDDDNLVLAHRACNQAVGSLPRDAKEAARTRLRLPHPAAGDGSAEGHPKGAAAAASFEGGEV